MCRVSDKLPTVTVVIAARPDQADVQAANAAQALDYPPDRLEIILARGKQPSVQRNAALRAARGEWIYFLDDDSIPPADNLRRSMNHLADSRVKIVGGPNLCPPDAPQLERVFALVLSSWLAFGPSRARYAKVGAVRPSGEKELILCNMLAHRETLLALGGFNEALYPNEENALMDEIQKRGDKLLYDPDFFVHRRPRRTLRSFARMLMTYGRGRAEQFREHPTPGSALNFVPPLFCLYLVLLPLVWLWRTEVGRLALWPLALYAVAVLAQGAVLLRHGGVGRTLLALPLIVLAHLLYGLGFWRGMFTRLKKSSQRGDVPVRLETVLP